MIKDELIKNFWKKVEIKKENECWNWIGAKQSKGYGSFGIGNGRTALAHRIAYEISCGPIPERMCVLHSCDNRACVNPDHLFLGSIADNNRDKLVKGRQARGENNGRAKMDIGKVITMRELYETGDYTYDSLAGLFAVSSSSVRKIVKKVYWDLPLAE